MRVAFRSLSGSLFLLFSLATANAWALDASFLYKVALEFGGDTLATPVYADGDTENVKANEGLLLAAGVSLVNEAKNIQTEISLGYKFGGSVASNGDVTFTTVPLDTLVFYRWDKVRAGGGVTYHFSPQLSVDGAGVLFATDTDYKNTLGLLLQADYRITEKLNVGLRYTAIEFDEKNSNRSFDGNTIGLVFSGSL